MPWSGLAALPLIARPADHAWLAVPRAPALSGPGMLSVTGCRVALPATVEYSENVWQSPA